MILGLIAAPAVQAKTWNLRFTCSYMENNPIYAKGVIPWLAQVKKATNDQVRIRHFNPNTICPEAEIYASIQKRVIEIGALNHSRNPGLFPLHDAFSLPMLSGNSAEHAQKVWNMYQKYPALRKEMAAINVLGYWAGGSMQILTRDKQVKTLEDMKGLRLACLNRPFADIVAALGADPIIVPGVDLYMALARNQVDGVFFSVSAMSSFKLNEMVKYATLGGFAMDSFYCGINKKVWSDFPDDIQKQILGTLGNEWPSRISSPMDQAEFSERERLSKDGMVFYDLPEQEKARWIKAVEKLDDAWKSNITKAGLMTQDEADAFISELRSPL